jgi:hypothetical protein
MVTYSLDTDLLAINCCLFSDSELMTPNFTDIS